MSNPGVIYLSSADTKKHAGIARFDIEDNIGEAIHIHFNNFRFDLTVKEFLQFATICREILKELYKHHPQIDVLKDLPGAFWKDFSEVIPFVSGIKNETVSLDSLRCLNVYNERYNLFNYSKPAQTLLCRKPQRVMNLLRKTAFKKAFQRVASGLLTGDNNAIYLTERDPRILYGSEEAIALHTRYKPYGNIWVTVHRITLKDNAPAGYPWPKCPIFKRLRVAIRRLFKPRW